MNNWESKEEEIYNTNLLEVIELFKYKLRNPISLAGGWFAKIKDLQKDSKNLRAEIKALKLLKEDIDLAIELSKEEIISNNNRIEKIRDGKLDDY